MQRASITKQFPIPAHHREQLWLGRATEGAPIFSP